LYEPGHHAVQARERAKSRARLRELEDQAIAAAVVRQVELGLDVVSDGEFRRWMFLNSFYDAVEGFSTDRNPIEFTNERGETAILQVHRVEERLRLVDSPAAREAAYLASITEHPFKVTFPAASIFTHPFSFEAGVTDRGYRDLGELVEHMISIERSLIGDAIAAGCRYVQLDFPLYPYLVDERWAGRFREAGHDVAKLVDGAIAADRAVLQGIPDDVTTALHICRGNYRSRWLCEGSLEPVAERVFELPYDVFLIEWDDAGRDGGFEALRFVPQPGPLVVLGLVSTKTRELESEDALLGRVHEAARYVSLEQLALSPQCGFASVLEGNEIDEATQWRKLELVARVAERLWSYLDASRSSCRHAPRAGGEDVRHRLPRRPAAGAAAASRARLSARRGGAARPARSSSPGERAGGLHEQEVPAATCRRG
jgi:5-methyltetrahydropteroyltriglutamate--homocysteine methyltransferase